MRYFDLPVTFLILGCTAALAEDDLSTIIPGMLSARKIVIKDLHPISYLEKLKVNKPKRALTAMERYILARHLLDCYHLCEALHHQNFSVSAQAPIMQLASETFAGFTQSCRGEEGGYLTDRIVVFLEKNGSLWEP